ncbi:MAG: SBBP repeat-containing protein [bacterium]|nr:SBBP repeat-containing protein [bacterium]
MVKRWQLNLFKFFFLLFFLFLDIISIYSLSNSEIFFMQFGTEEYDSGIDVCEDIYGNIFITGWTSGNINGNNNIGMDDIFLIKIDKNKNIKWTKTFGTIAQDIPWGIDSDSEGNIYITGETSGDLNGEINSGKGDLFLIKLNNSGKVIWTKLYGSVESETGYDLDIDESGNIYIGGEFWEYNVNGNLNSNILILKYDQNGNKIWEVNRSSNSYDRIEGVKIDPDGNLIAVGEYKGWIIYLGKYDKDGNQIWEKKFGTGDWDKGKDVDVDFDGNIYITGFTHGQFQGTQTYGSTDIFLMKFDKFGNNIWIRVIGTDTSDDVSSVAVDITGDNIYIAGDTYGSFYYNNGFSQSDCYIISYSKDGKLNWIHTFGTKEFDIIYNIKITNLNSLILSGSTKGTFHENVNKGGLDSYFMYWNISYLNNQNNLKIYPNPWKHGDPEEIIISHLPENSKLKIFDISGKLIFESESDNSVFVWNLKDNNGTKVSSGVYLCFAFSKNGINRTGKICILK